MQYYPGYSGEIRHAFAVTFRAQSKIRDFAYITSEILGIVYDLKICRGMQDAQRHYWAQTKEAGHD
jgi:hypothetical protein